MPDENKPATSGSFFSFSLSDILGAGKGIEKLMATVGGGISRLADGVGVVANVKWLDKSRADNDAYRTQVVGDAQTRVMEGRARVVAALASEGRHLQNMSITEGGVSAQLAGMSSEIQGLHERAQRRIAIENAMQQLNRETATAYAAVELMDEQQVSDIPVDPDWLTRYWRTVQDISQEEAQIVFGKILAGEIKQPGTFSIRTIDLLATLTKKEGEDFRALCSFTWYYEGLPSIMLFHNNSNDSNFDTPDYTILRHLEDIGLIAINPSSLGGYIERLDSMLLHYGDKQIKVKARSLPYGRDESPVIDIGVVLLTNIGVELAKVCQPVLNDSIMEYAIKHWTQHKHEVTRNY